MSFESPDPRTQTRTVSAEYLEELYAQADRLRVVEAENEWLRGYVAAVAAGLSRREMLAIERAVLGCA